jgi:glycosyltransferase involved in cell wall biosynthesis
VRVALVHDQLEQDGGAERVVWALHAMFPSAPIFTSIWNRRRAPRFAACDIRVSWLQRLPGIQRRPRAYAALYPLAFAGLDLSAFDLVISSSSYFAKGIRTPPGAIHLSYCHAAPNFIWNPQAYLGSRPARALTAPLRAVVKAWDRWAAGQPDLLIANSQATAGRLRAVYGRDAAVLPPPVGGGWFTAHRSEEFYLVVARLVAHKRVELAIEACARLQRPLVIVGEGRAASPLRRAAQGQRVHFLGRVADQELRDLYARAIAVLVPAEEDFGLVPVEAQAAGTPVIALDRAGARETVIDGITGVRYAPQTTEALVAAIRRAAAMSWDREAIQAHAAQFREDRFREGFMRLVDGQRACVPAGAERVRKGYV